MSRGPDAQALASAEALTAMRDDVRRWDGVLLGGDDGGAYVAQRRRLACVALAAVELDLLRHAVPAQVPGQLAIDDETGR